MIPLDVDRAVLARLLPEYTTAEAVNAEDPMELRRRGALLALPTSHGGAGAVGADAVAGLAALGAHAPTAAVDVAGQTAETLWACSLPANPARGELLSALAGRVGCGVERGMANLEQATFVPPSDGNEIGVVHLPGPVTPTVSVLIRETDSCRLVHLSTADLTNGAADQRLGRWGRDGWTLTLTKSDVREREILSRSLDAGDLNRLRAFTVTVLTVAAAGVVAGVLDGLVADHRHRAAAGSVIGKFAMAREALRGVLRSIESGGTHSRELAMTFLTTQAVGQTIQDLSDWAIEALGGMAFSQNSTSMARLALARIALPGNFFPTGETTLISQLIDDASARDTDGRNHVHS